jgi:hypothetical protein
MLEPERGEDETRRGYADRALARIVIPGAIFVAGVILLIFRQWGLGASLIVIVVPLVVMVDWLARLSLRSENDRADEAAARERFSRTGKW